MEWYIIFIFLALFFYSWAVWGAQREDEMCWWYVWLFGVGFVCDLVGTIPMICQTHQLSLYATLGVAALIVMGLHGSWAYLALQRHSFYHLFHRCSPWAYALWLITLLSGGVMHRLGR